MVLFLVSRVLAAGPDAPDRDVGIPVDGAPAAPAEAAPAEAAPAEAAPAEAAPAEAAPAEAAPPPPSPEARRALAEARYLEALHAWERRNWRDAARLATSALVLDPDLAPARLLAGYALLRLRRWDEANVTLTGLSPEVGPPSLPPEARATARRLLRRHLSPFRRDQWSLATGFTIVTERAFGEGSSYGGWLVAASAPVRPGLAVRLDGVLPFGTGDDLDVRGPRFTASAVAARPLGRGRVHADLLVGPTLWLAAGRYWPDGTEPFVGARGAVGLDWRFGPALGFRAEVGGSWFPALTDALPYYAAPVDVRVGLDAWFGR